MDLLSLSIFERFEGFLELVGGEKGITVAMSPTDDNGNMARRFC